MHARWNVKRLSLILAVLVALTVVVPATLAYVVERTGTLYNTFQPVGGTDPIYATVEVDITKTVRSMGNQLISPEGFRFHLVDTQSGETFEFVSDAFGKAAGTLAFNALEDADKTYTFRLYEVNDGMKDMRYDKKVHTVTIFVEQDVQTRQLRPQIAVDSVSMDTIAVAFTNVYAPAHLPPLTGDDFHFTLCVALMLTSAAFAVQLLRKPKKM